MTQTELESRAAAVTDRIAMADPGLRHRHLDDLHRVVTAYARSAAGIPPRLRRLQEELTDEAIEARFDNMPV